MHTTGLWLVVVALASCSPDAKCPEGTQADAARARRVLEILGQTVAGARLQQQAGPSRPICFADTDVGTVQTDGPITLPRAPDDRESAARLGHLLHHVVNGTPFPDQPDPARSCDDLVAAAVEAEAEGHALELRIRRELGVESPRTVFPFEAAFWSAPEAKRVGAIVDHMIAHPDGGGGLPGFVKAFSQRCQQSR